MKKLISPKTAAEILGVKLATIYSWTHKKKIPHYKLGNSLKFSKSEVVEFNNKRLKPIKIKEK